METIALSIPGGTPLPSTRSFEYTITSECPPIANPDYIDVCTDAPVTFNPLTNDTDSEGNMNASSLSIISQPANGTATVNSGGTITYTPNTGYNGLDEFVYQVCDNTALCSNGIDTSGKVSVNVGPYFELQNTDVCASATDGTIYFEMTSTTLTYDYTSGATYSGPATPTTATVDGTNTISGLGAGTYSVRLHNGTCYDDETVTISNSAGPSIALSYVTFCSGGTTSIEFNTTSTGFRYDYSSGASYTGADPPAAYISVNGTNSIHGISAGTYTVRIVESATGCFTDETINVNASFGSNPSITNTQETNICGATQGQFVFRSTPGFRYDYTAGVFYEGPSAPTAYTVSGTGNQFITGLDAGTYTMRVKNNFTSCFTDRTFTIGSDNPVLSLTKYDVCDGVGTGAVTFPTNTTAYRYGASVGSTYTGSMPPPFNTVNGTNTLSGGSPNTTYTVRLYDTGTGCYTDESVTIEAPDSPTFTLEKTDGCGSSTGTIFFDTSEGGLKFDYSTGSSYSGTNPPTSRSTITGTNYITGLTANTYTVRLYNIATGCSSDETITISASTNPSLSLSQTGSTCSDGTISFSTTAGLKYNYNNGGTYNGPASPSTYTTVSGTNTITGLEDGVYSVRLYDSSTGCYTDQSITVTKSANCPPVVEDNSATTLEDNSVVLTTITNNDSDQDGSIDLSTIDLDPSTAGVQTSYSDADGSWAVDAGGNVTFTPAADFFGVASISYVVDDNDGATSNQGNLSVTVNEVNDEPSFTKGANEKIAENSGAQTVTNWATSIDKGAANESGQTLTFMVTNDNNSLFSVQPSIDPTTGTLSYTPASNATGSAIITVILVDNGGTANGGDDTYTTQTFTIDVVAVPVIASSTGADPTTCGGTDGEIDLTFTDVPDGTYTLSYQDGVPSAQSFTNVGVSSGAATISGLSAGVYNDITIEVDGFTSLEDIDITLADPTTPTITLVSSSNPTTCSGSEGSISLNFTSIPNGTYTLDYVDGSLNPQTITGVVVNTGSATVGSLVAGVYNDISDNHYRLYVYRKY